MQPSPMPKAAPGAEHLDLSRIAQDLQIRKAQVEAVVQLLDEENTAPFVARYRKERTGGLPEDVVWRQIQAENSNSLTSPTILPEPAPVAEDAPPLPTSFWTYG